MVFGILITKHFIEGISDEERFLNNMLLYILDLEDEAFSVEVKDMIVRAWRIF